jgi:cyclopropane fatty-acyl-phospholipid synthase-like methyltransferase
MDETSRHMERIYSSTEEAAIPWNRAEPPAMLVELVRSGRLLPCRALDVGCGTGNYSIYLARQGFRTTGLDVSRSAIDTAREKAAREGVDVDFDVADMRADVSHVGGGFGFALEWMIMHHVFPEERAAYLENLRAMLAPGALCLSVSFSVLDPNFGEPPRGNWRLSPMGPRVYCSGIEELVALFSPAFEILEKEVTLIPGRMGENTVNRLLMRKR